jgi:hypothetical protein
MIDREETCTICYACEIDTFFLPCKHQSCQRCISRHLLNNQRCFFCNTPISELCSMLALPALEDGQCPADPSQKIMAEGLRRQVLPTKENILNEAT